MFKGEKVFIIPTSDYKDINPVDSGYHKCTPDFHYGPSARDYHILHFVISGCGIMKKNGQVYNITRGQCFIIRSGETAYYRADSSDPWTYIWLGFKTTLPLPETIKNDNVIDGIRYSNIFRSIMNYSEKDCDRSVFLTSKCWELFALMTPGDDIHEKNDTVLKAKTIIENDYMNDISVNEISDILHVDRTILCKSFKKKFGLSPKEYICKFRIDTACRLITEGGYSLSQIGSMCGYKEYCNFSRMFKRATGYSPHEYQKLHQKS